MQTTSGNVIPNKHVITPASPRTRFHWQRQMLCILLFSTPLLSVAADESCKFDTKKLSYVGTPLEQAKCLLRPVKEAGVLGPALQTLPSPLEKLVGSPIAIDKGKLRAYLTKKGFTESDLGGSLDESVSRAKDNDSSAPPATYFVIHDTSTPNYDKKDFPSDINASTWPYNDLKKSAQPIAHVFVSRTGDSRTMNSFSTPYRATKFELQTLGISGKGLFLHVENVQPRKSSSAGPSGNDRVAPTPGFTNEQLERLALIYISASVRQGSWLVPAYHAAIDISFKDNHDDPQNFDLPAWASAVDSLVTAISQ